jgi:hypothetical protein
MAVVSLGVELGSNEAERSPSSARQSVLVAGVRLFWLAVVPGTDPFPVVLAALGTVPGPG